MKFRLCLISAVILVASSGCVYSGHRGGGEYPEHGENRGHEEYRERSDYRSYPGPEVDLTPEQLDAVQRAA
jgi:hypothetical protein